MAQVHDRWLEMDLSYFDPGADLERQVEQVWDRLAPLLAQVKGDYGIFFNVGWLIDLVTEWTGDPNQRIPTQSRRTAQWAARSYQDLANMIELLRRSAAGHGLDRLQIGVLFVGWAHVVWPPELKIYDFDSSWYARHPELYDPPRSFINMPDLHPIKRLHADSYPYAAFPMGIAEGTYFPQFFGAQWAHLANFLNLDALHLRDGLTGPMIYTRNGPFGTSAPSDPAVIEAFSQSVRDLYKYVKLAAPDKRVFGYSSAISPVADWRVGCVDFEALVADGYIDAWVEQTWGGAWQDWWHQLWKGWTFQTAYLLTRGAMIARANQQRETPCRFYNLIETWDGWEPWDTLHQVPHKLRWAMWAFNHAAVVMPDGIKVPDGSYISWMNNAERSLLSEADVDYIRQHLDQAQASAAQLEQVFGTTLVYNREAMAWLSAHAPDRNAAEWVDDHAALLMKWGVPALSITRAEWLNSVDLQRSALLVQTPKLMPDGAREALLSHPKPVLVTGCADLIDEQVQNALGIRATDQRCASGFYVSSGIAPDTPPYDRPYLPTHVVIEPAYDTKIHYRSADTPLITQRGFWFYWQPPDWSEPFNPFVPKYQLGSTHPHYLTARLLNEAAHATGLSYVEISARPMTITFHLWRSAGQIYLLLGNLETGEFGDSRTPRPVVFHLSRAQLGLGANQYCLERVDAPDKAELPSSADDEWLTFFVELPPEASAVYRLSIIENA
jgi:hypothetical protein